MFHGDVKPDNLFFSIDRLGYPTTDSGSWYILNPKEPEDKKYPIKYNNKYWPDSAKQKFIDGEGGTRAELYELDKHFLLMCLQ